MTYPIWVLSGSELIAISKLANIPAKERPLVKCPSCRQTVTPKLGNKNVHHFAHRPGSLCELNNSETALHFNTKIHIFIELRKGNRLFVNVPCKGNFCETYRDVTILENWDSVDIELGLGSFRPDITLIRNSKPIGVIEIYATHKMSQEKIDFLSNIGVPHFEIEASEDIYNSSTSWDISKPLPISTRHEAFSNNSWECDNCKNRKEELRQQRIKEFENRVENHAYKMVDYYYSSGKKYRQVYYIKFKYINGILAKAFLQDSKGKIYLSINSPINKDTIQIFNIKVKGFISSRSKANNYACELTNWTLWTFFHKPHPTNTYLYPFSYEWDSINRLWKKIPPSSHVAAQHLLRNANIVSRYLLSVIPEMFTNNNDIGILLNSMSDHFESNDVDLGIGCLRNIRTLSPHTYDEIINILKKRFSDVELQALFS